jgi:hypothetical protein
MEPSRDFAANGLPGAATTPMPAANNSYIPNNDGHFQDGVYGSSNAYFAPGQYHTPADPIWGEDPNSAFQQHQAAQPWTPSYASTTPSINYQSSLNGNEAQNYAFPQYPPVSAYSPAPSQNNSHPPLSYSTLHNQTISPSALQRQPSSINPSTTSPYHQVSAPVHSLGPRQSPVLSQSSQQTRFAVVVPSRPSSSIATTPQATPIIPQVLPTAPRGEKHPEHQKFTVVDIEKFVQATNSTHRSDFIAIGNAPVDLVGYPRGVFQSFLVL